MICLQILAVQIAMDIRLSLTGACRNPKRHFPESRIFLEHFTFEMLHISNCTPPACSGKNAVYRCSRARKPFGANGHGCAASGRSLALGRGFRSRGHQSNSLIPIVNCSSNEIFPMQVCRHTLPQFMSTNGVVVAALLSTYGRPRCRNLFQDRAASLSDSSRVWVAASSILKSSSSKSTGFIK